MSTSKKKSATTPLPKKTSADAAIKNIDGISVNNNLQDPAAEDELDEAARQKTSPQNYFYARAGTFAEGVYTEF